MLILQGVVDEQLLFIDTYCWVPGQLMLRSDLTNKLINALQDRKVNLNGVDVPLHLLEDPAYALSSNLMKPYPGQQLSVEQESFNAYH